MVSIKAKALRDRERETSSVRQRQQINTILWQCMWNKYTETEKPTSEIREAMQHWHLKVIKGLCHHLISSISVMTTFPHISTYHDRCQLPKLWSTYLYSNFFLSRVSFVFLFLFLFYACLPISAICLLSYLNKK